MIKNLKLFNILMLLFITASFGTFAQTDTTKTEFPLTDGKVIYELTENFQGTKKDVLYDGAKKWFNDSFEKGNYVIQMEDREAGQIIGKANTTTQSDAKSLLIKHVAFLLKFNVLINFKDDKARIRIYDITTENISLGKIPGTPLRPIEYYTNIDTSKFNPKQLERITEMQKAINERFNSILKSFSTSMKESTSDDF